MKPKIISLIRKHWYKFILADMAFFALLGILLYYARRNIANSILLLQGYAGEISTLSQQVTDQGINMIGQVEAVSNVISPLMTSLKLMIYVVVPIGLYLIWCITQFVFYNLMSGKNVLDYKAKMRFFFVNIPLFGLLLLLLDLLFRQFTVDEAINVNVYIISLLLIVMILLMYYTQILYSVMNDFSLVKALKKSLSVSLRKIYLLFPLIILNVIFFFLAFIFLWDVLIKVVSGVGGYVLSVLLLIMFMLVWTSYKVFLIIYVRSKSL